jgi:hypothetical protein
MFDPVRSGYRKRLGVAIATTLFVSQGSIASVDNRTSSIEANPFSYSDSEPVTDFWNGGANNIGGPQALMLASSSTGGSSAESDQFDAFFAEGYEWNDAVVLAKAWGMNDPVEAKLKAGFNILQGHRQWIADFLSEAGASDDNVWNAYANSTYDWDDAEQLAKYWGLADPGVAKMKMGQLILDNQSGEIDDALVLNAYDTSIYQWDDAALLAKYWGLEDPGVAKMKMGQMIRDDHESLITQALIVAAEGR